VSAFRKFREFDLGHECIPDATTLMNFRPILEQNILGAAMFNKVGALLFANDMKLSGETIVDATDNTGPTCVARK